MAIIDTMNRLSSKRGSHALAALVLLAGAPVAFADNLEWRAGDGAWENGANWLGGQVPGATDFAALKAPLNPTITSTGANNIALELATSNNLDVSAGKLTVLGTIQTEQLGTFSVTNGAEVDAGRINHDAVLGAGVLIDGAGTAVTVTEGVFSSGLFQVSGGATLGAESIDNFATMKLESGAQVTANSMINHGVDPLHNSAPAFTSISGSGSALTIHGALTNDGAVQVSHGGLLDTHSIDLGEDGSLVVTAAGRATTQSVINHGLVQVHSDGLPGGGGAHLEATDVFTNFNELTVTAEASASIATLDNRANVFVAGTLSGEALKNADDGVLALTNGASVSFDEVLAASRFGISIDGVQAHLKSGKFQQLSGVTNINGGTLGASSEFGVQFAGGELQGHGLIDGLLTTTADALLNPGDALDATQRFDVAAGLKLLGGTFAVDLGGTAAGEFDALGVTGAATLGGTLRVALQSGYVPILGDAFDIILADSISGAFGTILLPTLGDGLKFTSLNGGNFFRLQVAAVPLPAPVLLLSGALGVLGFCTRRRARG